MNSVIERALEPGETVLWTGAPEEFVTMDKTYGPRIKKGIIIKAVCTAVLILASIFLAIGQGKSVSAVLILVILAVAAYMIAAPWFTAKKLRREVNYAITDRRLILAVNTAEAVPFTAIREAAFRTDEDGHTTLLVGREAVSMNPGKWRNFTPVTPYMDSKTNTCECMVFYALPEAAKIKQLLVPYITFR